VIHFIGICLFSTQPPNQPGVHVILPRIVAQSANPTDRIARNDFQEVRTPAKPAAAPSALTQVPTILHPTGPDVEPHIAFIAFPTTSVMSEVGWHAVPLPQANPEGLSYIELRGEHVRFHTLNGLNDPVPTGVSLPLPKVRNSCNATSLTPAFQPNGNAGYTGASGVIEIVDGKLSACSATVTDTTSGQPVVSNRVDTQLTMTFNGAIVIRTTDGSKVLVLSGATPIYVANVPVPWPATFTHASNSLPHYLAYYRMTNNPNPSSCPALGAPTGKVPDCPVQPGFIHVFNDHDHRHTNTAVSQNQLLQSAAKNGGIEAMTSNSECSNSQFP
jgi:hypothetical protein